MDVTYRCWNELKIAYWMVKGDCPEFRVNRIPYPLPILRFHQFVRKMLFALDGPFAKPQVVMEEYGDEAFLHGLCCA